MANYYVYRINPSYDGFYPSRLEARSERQILVYNWGTYAETLEPGDIVLTYFTGNGCRAGIYAIALVRSVDPTLSNNNVRARLLHVSTRNDDPLYPVKGNKRLFERIRTRRRGAEVIVPHTCTEDVYGLLSTHEELLRTCRKWKIELPGSVRLGVRGLGQVPLIEPTVDFSTSMESNGIVGCYWIRPTQASWILAPKWLLFVTRLFRAFKAGDMTHLETLAGAIVRQVRRHAAAAKIGLVVPVPLNDAKRDAGESDRVQLLAKEVSTISRWPISCCLRVSGNISRVRYKKLGRTAREFEDAYNRALSITRLRDLKRVAESDEDVLLIDDVYTDGLTTRLVSQKLINAVPALDGRVRIATLGIHAKKRNLNQELIHTWG